MSGNTGAVFCFLLLTDFSYFSCFYPKIVVFLSLFSVEALTSQQVTSCIHAGYSVGGSINKMVTKRHRENTITWKRALKMSLFENFGWRFTTKAVVQPSMPNRLTS